MAIARSTGALFGTDEATLTAVANNAVGSGALVDLLGDNTSSGDIWLYAVITSTVAVGSIQVRFNPGRRANSGTEEYQKTNYEISIPPTNGTQKIPLGKRSCPRYAGVDVFNNATGASASVAILYELEKFN